MKFKSNLKEILEKDIEPTYKNIILGTFVFMVVSDFLQLLLYAGFWFFDHNADMSSTIENIKFNAIAYSLLALMGVLLLADKKRDDKRAKSD